MSLHRIFLVSGFCRRLTFGLLLGAIVSFGWTNAKAQEEEEFTQEDFSQNGASKNDSVELFNKGQDAHSKGDLVKALDFYNKALIANPKFPEAEYQRGVVHQALGNFSKSETSFRRVIEIKKDWSQPYSQLGRLLLNRGDFPNAKKLLSAAIKLDERNYEAYYTLTDLHIKMKASDLEFKDLLTTLSVLSRDQNAPIVVWTLKAAAERRLGNIADAKKSVMKTLANDSGNLFALTELAEIYLALNKNKKALETSKLIVKLAPQSQKGKLLLARAYYSQGNSGDAKNVLTSIASPDKEVLAFQKIIETDGTTSINTLEEMLSNDPNNIGVLSRLCRLSRASDARKALNYCNRALTIEKSNINHAIGYGAALVQLKQYSNAVVVLNNLLKHSPENYAIHANLATALFQMQNYEAASREYLWIIEKRPKLAVAYYFLAISFDRGQNYREAMVNYRKFLELASADKNRLEIEKVKLRVPILADQVKRARGKKKKSKERDD